MHTRSNSNTSTASSTKANHLLIYSLQSQSVVKQMNDFQDEEEDQPTQITCIKSNEQVMAIVKISSVISYLLI